jgi:hypothetical protein
MANLVALNADALALLGGANVETLAGNKTLVASDQTFQKLDPGGAGRNVVLPPEGANDGLWFYIMNAADGAETLTVQNDALGTVVALPQNEAAIVICDGTTWVHMGILTIQLS